jgi:hypothetical protein
MTADHTSYEELAAQRRDSADYREGYAEAQRAYLIGRAVRERRLALGLSQIEVAARDDCVSSVRLSGTLYVEVNGSEARTLASAARWMVENPLF